VTKDKIREVLKLYKDLLRNYPENLTDNHCFWMLFQISDMLNDDPDMEKVMRWLGFVQGCLWCRNYYSIEELKEHNRKTK